MVMIIKCVLWIQLIHLLFHITYIHFCRCVFFVKMFPILNNFSMSRINLTFNELTFVETVIQQSISVYYTTKFFIGNCNIFFAVTI